MVDICLSDSERGAISIFHSPQVVLLVRQDRQDYDTLSNPNEWMTAHLNKLTFGRKLWSQQNILSINISEFYNTLSTLWNHSSTAIFLRGWLS